MYKHIKQDYRIEPYLYIHVAKYRIAIMISSVRLCSRHLGIEVGRYAQPVIPMEKRLCNECKGQIDDEVHFLTECNKCDKLRKDIFDSLRASHPFTLRLDNKKTFIELMTSNLNVLVATGKFIHLAFKQQQ